MFEFEKKKLLMRSGDVTLMMTSADFHAKLPRGMFGQNVTFLHGGRCINKGFSSKMLFSPYGKYLKFSFQP